MATAVKSSTVSESSPATLAKAILAEVSARPFIRNRESTALCRKVAVALNRKVKAGELPAPKGPKGEPFFTGAMVAALIS
jgi:hypothetical protein